VGHLAGNRSDVFLEHRRNWTFHARPEVARDPCEHSVPRDSFWPYWQLQLTGVDILVSIASVDGLVRTPAMVISVARLVACVFTSGVRAVAWVSLLKGVLMMFATLSISIATP
jgi:hypothetical protein